MTYPLIQKHLGLEVFEALNFATKKNCVDADALEKVLEKGVEVTGCVDEYTMTSFRSIRGRGPENDTHSALLIGIKPIAEPSADDLLLELVNKHDSPKDYYIVNFIDKAKAYLKGKGKL